MIRIVILWVILIAANLAIRPLMPIDETRYVGVAWEMWVRDDFLVPHLNGETYSHKPPLLFWLMSVSWWLFGVNDWTPRVISPLFALSSTLLSDLMAKELWRDRPQVAELTPLILLGTLFWLLYSTLTMFDMLLAFFVLLAIFSVLKLSQSNSWRNVFLLGIAIGGGVLSKGPVVLLQILPVALLAPWWIQQKAANFSWKTWYLKLVVAVLIGASLALSWAIPAGISGGENYRNAIFFGQTSGRLVNSFAHQLPFWWYLEQLPLLLLPWLFLKPLWQGVRQLRLNDDGVRFCLAWVLPVFIMFSCVSGKRIHYLLPLMPALALLVARAVDEITDIEKWRNACVVILYILSFIVFAVIIFLIFNDIYYWTDKLRFSLTAGLGSLLVIIALPLGIYWWRLTDVKHVIFYISTSSIIVMTLLAGIYFESNASRHDTRQLAEKISQFQTENKAIAFYASKYHDQFQFTGRLTQPLTVLNSPDMLKSWAQEHSDGFILVNSEKLPENVLFYSHAYRAGELGFIRSQTLLEHLDFIHSL